MKQSVKISVNDLKVGMIVMDLDRPWLETPFLFQGFTLQSDADIKAVQQYCKHVYIDPASKPANKKTNNKQNKQQAPSKQKGVFNLFRRGQEPEDKVPVEQELQKAIKTQQKSSSLVRSFMDDIRLGNGLNTAMVKETVNDCVESILNNSDAMMWVNQLKNQNDFEADHCLGACILSIAFGKFLGLPRVELENLGVCALLHDVGKLQLPAHIVNKKTPLDDSEWQVMRRHPEKSRQILMSSKDIYFGAVDVAYTHHERVDGKGYPRGLQASQLSPFSKIVALVDSYDAMTSPKHYAEELTPFHALRELNKNKDKQYDGPLVEKFIEFVGVFPVGSIVEVSTGEVGIVISSNRRQSTKPKIMIMLDAEKFPCKNRVLNLAVKKPNQTAEQEIIIKKILKAGEYGIDPKELQKKGLRFKVE